jgi:NCS1 family nucleobase:cation symporter-1
MAATVGSHLSTDGGPARAEVPTTLAEPAPRTLGFLDQIGLWGNLGVSLLGPVGAVFLLQPAGFPPMPIVAAFLATVAGTILGTLLLSLSAVPGAQTGAPAMVLLRGLFGARVSYLPTVLNLAQCVGWGTFELVIIAESAQRLWPGTPRWPFVVLAGALTTLMALRPLGVVRVLRRYAVAAVVVVTVYLYVQLLRHPLPALTTGSWAGFWAAADVAIAVAVSWVPLASDYSRHSRSARAAFLGSFLGYAPTQIAYYTLGLLAYATVVRSDGDVLGAFVAVPLGSLAFGVLVLRELDESFVNVYSTVVSTQNLRPLADRRLLALIVGGLTTALALALNIKDYQSFLYLLGSVFVPMFAVFAVDYFLLRRPARWDVTALAPPRWLMLVPWLLGFAAYQLVNPGSLSWWVTAWTAVRDAVGFTPATWMSASVVAFVVAAIATLGVAGLVGRRRSAAR